MGISEKSILRDFILLQRPWRDTRRDLAALEREKSLACKTCMMMRRSYRFKISSNDMGARLALSAHRAADRGRTSLRCRMSRSRFRIISPRTGIIEDSMPSYPSDLLLQSQSIFQQASILNLVVLRCDNRGELPPLGISTRLRRPPPSSHESLCREIRAVPSQS